MRTFATILFLTVLLVGCSSDHFDTGAEAEAAFVDLFDALHSGDTEGSQAAATRLNKRVRSLRLLWLRPLSEGEMDERMYRFDRAECAFHDALRSVAAHDLDLASIQLDRAVYELLLAEPAAADQLYVAGIYDFVAAWLEVQELQATASPSAGLHSCMQHALREWAAVRELRPDAFVYPKIGADPLPFAQAHALLDGRLTRIGAALRAGNPPTPRAVGDATAALWELLRLFGTSATETGESEEGEDLVTPAIL